MTHLLTFEKRSVIPANLDAVWEFHAAPGAFRRLTPLPIIGQIHQDQRTSLTQGRLDFTLWFGPLPIRWVADHEPGPSPTSFRDRMVTGPLEIWVHEHLMEETVGGVLLTDRITYQHKPGLPGWISRVLFSRRGLETLFAYRHWITRRTIISNATPQGFTQTPNPTPELKGQGRHK
jgi:ligand-binding SRPBCC domain-containing protein